MLNLISICFVGAPPQPLNVSTLPASNVVLLPPASSTAIPKGQAPIIVPNLSPPPGDAPMPGLIEAKVAGWFLILLIVY